MFMTGVFSGASLNTTDPEQERDPPAHPTPVTFPNQVPCHGRAWDGASPPPELQPLFSRILRPSDVSPIHLEALNIQACEPCPLENILPLAPDGRSYLPPLTPDQAMNAASYAEVAKLDAGSARRRKEFDDKMAELRIDNDTGFRVIARTTKPGVKPPRLAYLRKFWEGLESVAQYWDTSLDQYFEGYTSKPDANSVKDAKRQRLDSNPSGPSILTLQTASDKHVPSKTFSSVVKTNCATSASGKNQEYEPGIESAMNGDDEEKLRSSRSTSATPEPRPCLRYKGRRMASGRDMPDQFRIDTVKAFVESVAWSFHASVATPRQMPIVQINKLNLPVRQTAAVYQLPLDRMKQRQGWYEGPVLCIQVRSETDFEGPSLTEAQRQSRARLDQIREIGGLLQLAQERHRQGKVEGRPGEGKWWTSVPRWGGGPGGEVENADGGQTEVKDVLAMAEEMVGASQKDPRLTKRPKRKTPAMLWKELKPGSKLWDPKTEYRAIGKEAGSDYDEVFMVSSLNHHVSILKLTVHSAYIEYTKSQTLPDRDNVSADENWCRPKLQRTRWFDLLDVDQRVEAFRALWGVMAYLMRGSGGDDKPAAAAAVATSSCPSS